MDVPTTHDHSTEAEYQKKVDCIYQESVPRIVTIDNIRVLGLDPDDEHFYINFPAERRKGIIRKV